MRPCPQRKTKACGGWSCSCSRGERNTVLTESFEKTITEEKIERWRYPRFFGETNESIAVIRGDDAKHIVSVLRMKAGELIILCDGEGNDCLCRLSLCQRDIVEAEILDRRKNEAEPSVNVTLLQCLPKSDKMDFIVQKATELGAVRVVPVLSARCVSRPDEKSAAHKAQRWQKIAVEAAKQSGRGKIPEIAPISDFKNAVREYAGAAKGIMFYECGGKSVSELVDPNIGEYCVFIGSEGGFEPEEAAFAVENGVEAATLGRRILRCETAPIAALSVLMNLTGNM